MSRRGHPSSHSTDMHRTRGSGGFRNGGFMSTTSLLMLGIFLTSAVVLIGMHYTVQISSYIQHTPKLRRIISPVEDYFRHDQNINLTDHKDPKSMEGERSGSGEKEDVVQGDRSHEAAEDSNAEVTYAYEAIETSTNSNSHKVTSSPHNPPETERDDYGYGDAENAEESASSEKAEEEGFEADAGIQEGYGYADSPTDTEAAGGAHNNNMNKNKDGGEQPVVKEDGNQADAGGDDKEEEEEGGEGYGEGEEESETVTNNQPTTTTTATDTDTNPIATATTTTTKKHRKPVYATNNAITTAFNISPATDAATQALLHNKLLSTLPVHYNKKKQVRDPYNYVVNIDPDWGVKGKWDLPYIEVLPTKKPPLKKDRTVVFDAFSIPKSGFNSATIYKPSGIVGMPRALSEANSVLETHPLYNNAYKDTHSLEDVMYYITHSEQCVNQPIFLTMATVGDELYWQLIENFVYGLVKFDVSHCALIICVSDTKCMQMCANAKFPCYNYVASDSSVSVMEQIAQVKLLHIPKALTRGVDVFMLDLDVGFLQTPKYMVEVFRATPIVDVFVQEDYLFIMNRTKAGWGTYFTEPLPNIGLFLCRGNNKTARMFEIAWHKYQQMQDSYYKSQPGKDQNTVLDAMRIGRGTFGLKYAYFSHTTTPLLDKLVNKEGNTIELGGEVVQAYSNKHNSIAMHTTCYEKSTKVMGLKATNAFWNPRYYDPLHRTITKQLVYTTSAALLEEVRSLVWLALSTKRSLILPNILGDHNDAHMKIFDTYNNQTLWPGFRVAYLKRNKGRNAINIQILEPAYYWRIKRDYDIVPVPIVVYYGKKDNLYTLRESILKYDAPRVIVHPNLQIDDEKDVIAWADDSVGLYNKPYAEVIKAYKPLPSVKDIRTMRGVEFIDDVMQNMRTCNNIFGRRPGSRTCFEVCD